MVKECPHCGAQLPPVADAFCSECRQSLEDAPIIRRLDDKVRKVVRSEVEYLGLIWFAVGLILVMRLFVRLGLGGLEEWQWWYEAAWGILGVVLLVIGARRLSPPDRPPPPPRSGSEEDQGAPRP